MEQQKTTTHTVWVWLAIKPKKGKQTSHTLDGPAKNESSTENACLWRKQSFITNIQNTRTQEQKKQQHTVLNTNKIRKKRMNKKKNSSNNKDEEEEEKKKNGKIYLKKQPASKCERESTH